MKKNHILVLLTIAIVSVSCATQHKLKEIRETHRDAQLTLSDDVSNLPEMKVQQITRDTLKIQDEDGTDILIMKAVKDEETGEMVAADILDAAKITARFRNVAERKGKVDLAFDNLAHHLVLIVKPVDLVGCG